MKKLFILFGMFAFSFVLLSCGETITTIDDVTSSESITTTESLTTIESTSEVPTTEVSTEALLDQQPNVESGYLASNVQDGLILHAWNWSLSEIEDQLEDIAIAGFSTVQISPMQPQKDFFGITSWGEGWWRLYQPLGFVIATSDHSIGNRSDLESLTQAADAYGIKIIVDIVANHLSSDSSSVLDSNVADFETEIYNQNLIRTGNGVTSDSSVYSVTKGSLGALVDLETENDIVQEAVLDLLKDYVDAGVDGFRFDAAKHIETEYDGDYASDFWPYIIDGVNAYASSDLYIYGEILNTVGVNRSYSDYTEYMAITTNTVSDQIRSAVARKDLDDLSSVSYLSEVPANQSVLWPESHDDYAAGHTDGLSVSIIHKTYAIEASRALSTSLYFARPNASTMMGEIGSYEWQAQEVMEVNRFHNYFIDASEYLSFENGFFINERYSENKEGLVIVDIEGGSNVNNLSVNHISDGSYIDQLTGQEFTVINGKISGNIGETGIAVIYNNPYQAKPVVYVSDTGLHSVFTDTLDLTIYSYNTSNAYYTINGGEEITFSGTIDIVLSHPDSNAEVRLDIYVSNGEYQINKSYTYIKSNQVIEEVVINNLDDSFISPEYRIAAWTWQTGQDGAFVMGTYDRNGTFVFDLPEGNDYFLLVLFPVATSSNNWDLKVYQTGDIKVPSDGVYDGSDLNWN